MSKDPYICDYLNGAIRDRNIQISDKKVIGEINASLEDFQKKYNVEIGVDFDGNYFYRIRDNKIQTYNK